MTKHSKVFGLDSKTGAISWERAAIGHIGDIHLIHRKESTNVALVIDSTDTKKTRVAEYCWKLNNTIESLLMMDQRPTICRLIKASQEMNQAVFRA